MSTTINLDTALAPVAVALQTAISALQQASAAVSQLAEQAAEQRRGAIIAAANNDTPDLAGIVAKQVQAMRDELMTTLRNELEQKVKLEVDTAMNYWSDSESLVDAITKRVNDWATTPAFQIAVTPTLKTLVTDEVSDFDLSDMIEDAIGGHDFSDAIECAVRDYDMGDQINEALRDHDFSEALSSALEDHDLSDQLRDAVHDQTKNLIEELEGAIDAKVEDALSDKMSNYDFSDHMKEGIESHSHTIKLMLLDDLDTMRRVVEVGLESRQNKDTVRRIVAGGLLWSVAHSDSPDDAE
jgi:hypothetical protein